MHRRRLLALPLSCLLPGVALAAPPPGQLGEDEVEVSYDRDTYVGRFSFVVPVPQAIAWEVLTDFEHMAGFVPNVEESRIVEREANTLQVAQRGKLDFGPFSMRFESVRRIEMRRREGILLSRGIAGSARRLESEMRLTPEAAGTRLSYRLEMVPDRWLPSSLGMGFLQHELAEQFTAIAREMLRRAGR